MEWFNLGDSVNQLGLLGAVAILALTIFIVGGYIKKMKDSKAEGELTEEDWDGIKEFKNNIPIGWGATYLVLLIWALWYWFVGYPLNTYSQIGEYNDEVKAYNAKFEAQWQNIDTATLTKMGQNLFLVQCSQCHGITTEGMNGTAANLAEWGREEGIITTIKNGSKGLGYMLGDMLPIIGSSVATSIMDIFNKSKEYTIDTKRTRHKFAVTTNLDVDAKSFEINLNYKVNLK